MAGSVGDDGARVSRVEGGVTRALAVSIGQFSDKGRKEINQDFHGALVPEGAALAL